MTLYGLETIRTEMREGGALVATLDRPERLNALDHRMWDDLSRLVDRVEGDPSARVLIITGGGRGFCAGADLDFISAIPEMTTQEFMRHQEYGAGVIAKLRHLSTPVVAAVNGPAAGGGLAVALAADVRVAGPAARFNVAFVRLGISGCDVGVSWLLPRVVGLGHASELMLTGRLIDAAEAYRIGLVNRVVEDGDLMAAASALAAEIAANSPFGLRLTKQALQLNVDAPSLEAAIEVENRNQVLASRTADMAEAVAAFQTGREPRFQDR
jgi:enoyl-CoA hydratase